MRKNNLLILMALLLCVFSQATYAVPAVPYPVDYQLPDGTKITIQLRGDEHVNWAETPDGYTLLRNSDGYFEYAQKNAQGDLVLSGVRAKNVPQRTTADNIFLRQVPQKLSFSTSQAEAFQQLRQARTQAMRQASQNTLQHSSITGTVHAPLILVQFPGKSFTKTQIDFDMLCNQVGYAEGTATGSVHDYFLATSYNQLDYQVDVYGPFTMSQTIDVYDNNFGGNSQMMAVEAANAAHAAGCDFSQYDVDNDGYVDGMHIIYAGYDQSAGAPAGTAIWAHAWGIYYQTLMIDGKRVLRFSCSSELRNTEGSTITPIGVIAHELSHVFGLPDLYDTDYGDSGGQSVDMGQWDIMASGSWNNYGDTPPYHSAWCRDNLGWVMATELTLPTDITLPNPAIQGAAYKIATETADEYFLVENRQKQNWDAYIPGSGMLIYHVDENRMAAMGNAFNADPAHRGLYVKQAGCGINSDCSTNRDCDPYPYGTNNSFTDISIPNSHSWAGSNTNKPITEITHDTSNKTIVFKFMGGDPTCPFPKNLDVEDITTTSATITWTAGGTETQWYVSHKKQAETTWSSETSVSVPFCSLSGLDVYTNYNFRIRAYCSASDMSIYRTLNFKTLLCENACNYTLTMNDSYDDGWDGDAYVEIKQNSISIGTYRIEYGESGTTASINLCSNLSTEVSFSTGTFPNEISFELKDTNGTTLASVSEGQYSYGNMNQIDIIATFTSSCFIVTPPTVVTNAATNVTQTAATLNKTVTAGTETVSAEGFYYRKSTESTWTLSSDGNLTGLSANTQYDFYAYATTASGTVDGNTLQFTTLAHTPPTVVTNAATNVTQTAATLNKTVTAGTETVSAEGFYYRKSTESAWTLSSDGNLTGLSANTQYDFYAYATTASGTVSGNTLQFTTTAVPTYGVSIASFTGGTVSKDKTAYEESETVTLTIAPDAGYVLDAISAYKTGDVNTSVILTGSGNTRTFVMPAYGVTVTATFRNPDLDAVNTAKELVEGMTSVTVAQTTANTEADVKTWLAQQINALSGMNATGITVTAANITLSGFIPAAAGNADTPAGTNGSFNFTVLLTKGASNVSTASKPGVITATAAVNAATPSIDTPPQGATYNVGDNATALTVSASVSDGGTLSFQWYSNSANSNAGGTSISGATNASYTPPTASAGTTYYYVVVTNTNSGATGVKTATATSITATVTVNALVNAETPVISAQPTASTTVNVGASVSLSVTAGVTDGGTLTYQWYSNTANNSTSGTLINGAASASYAPSTASAGTTYYYVIVTNTNNGATSAKTASTTSAIVSVTVNNLVNAATPSIDTPPQGATYNAGDNAAALTVSASVSDGGTLSYQWYSNTTNGNTGGTSISGATSASYTPPTNTAGTTYYYVVVTNTNSGVTGVKTASAASNAATVTVNNLINAETPVISAQPTASTTVNVGASVSLSVTAGVTDGGTLTYQWYSNTANNSTSGTLISGATSASYAPPTASAGTTYYYVVVTNTNSGATGAKTASTTSAIVSVTVNNLVNAAVPVINGQPTAATTTLMGSVVNLSVLATVSDAGTLSYQWYSNSANGNTGGTAISGATSANYAPPTNTDGTMYYYVIVTNTNNNATGEKTASTTSDVASVTVNVSVNAETPAISAQPTASTTVNVGASVSLSVAAGVSDGGTLSYQWYSNTTNDNTGGTLISNATNASYTPPTNTVGTTYYYVVVTNTNNGATGAKTASTTSYAASVTVNALVVNAETPVISAQPTASTTVNVGASVSLSVTAGVTDGGTLTYQWYSNTANNSTSGTLISGATSASYAPSTASAGTTYYYVVVTNTNNGATGAKTASTTSAIVSVTVNNLVNAAVPSIATHPQGATYNTGDNAAALTVSATVSDGGTLSYQWYSNTTNGNTGGTAISGATSASYTPPTNTAGTTYYYVVVTNTNSGVTGVKTASAASNAATVTVNALVVNAETPAISGQPAASTTVNVGASISLSVTAGVTDGGTLSYQWHSNTTNGNTGGTLISNATNASYVPPTNTVGTTYYYVVVTNTNNGVNGVKTASTTSNTASVTVNAVTPPDKYAITITPTTNGTVTVNPSGSVEAGTSVTLTIAPANGYETETISAYRTDAQETVVALNGTDNTRTFTMPAYGVTVRATFKKTQDQLDKETVLAAQAAIEGGTYRVAQATANDASSVNTWLVNTLNVLFGSSYNIRFRSAETPILADVMVTAITPAIAGTVDSENGTDGAFTFTVVLTKGTASATAIVATGKIVATPYSVTPLKRIELSQLGDLTVRIVNTGNVATGDLTVALTGADASSFMLSETTVNSLAVGGEANITLTPNGILADGTYTAILTVGAEGMAPETITITYIVTYNGIENSQPVKLQAVSVTGGLQVRGLITDEIFGVYNVSGLLQFEGKATASEQLVRLREHGIYIVVSGNRIVKAVY